MGKVMNGPHKYIFTQFEQCFMRVHFHAMTNRQLSDMLGHKLTLVRMQCYAMGLKRMELEYWTDEQVQFLKDNYKLYGDSELAEMYEVKWHKGKGWSKKHIEKKRRYLALQRTAGEKYAIYERNKAMGRWALCPVKKWETIGVAPVFELRVWANQDGRNYLVIKLKDGWVHYAPWLYEQIYGPVPEGHVVRTKDNDPMNIKPGNLELIDRAENAKRNASLRLPAELKETIIIINKIKRKIYETEQRN